MSQLQAWYLAHSMFERHLIAAGAYFVFGIVVLAIMELVTAKRSLDPKPEFQWDLVALRAIIWGVLVLAIALLSFAGRWMADVIAAHPERLLSITSAPYTIAAAIIFGIAFFWFRCRAPLYYGLSEIAAAIMTIAVSSSTTAGGGFGRIVGLLGAVYILVRGLDNMDKRLKGRELWAKVFWGRFPVT